MRSLSEEVARGPLHKLFPWRTQDHHPDTALFLSKLRLCAPSGDVNESPQWTHCGRGDRNQQGVVAISDVRRAAAALLRRVAEDNEIPIGVLREFAELVLRSELVEASRQVLEGPSSHRVDFLIRYYIGRSPNGQFFTEQIQTLGPAVQLYF